MRTLGNSSPCFDIILFQNVAKAFKKNIEQVNLARNGKRETAVCVLIYVHVWALVCNDVHTRDFPSLVCADRKFLTSLLYHLCNTQLTQLDLLTVCVKQVRLFSSVFDPAGEIKSFYIASCYNERDDVASKLAIKTLHIFNYITVL